MKNGKKIKTVLGSILAGFSILLTADACIVMMRRIKRVANPQVYKKNLFGDLLVTTALLITALDLLFNLFTRWKKAILRFFGWGLRLPLYLASGAILFFFGRTLIGSLIKTRKHAGYAVVLGMALENGKPTKDLIYRVKTAGNYLKENPKALLILTGGVPDPQGKTEAQTMRELLIQNGVPAEKMILEDRSESTKTNFSNILEIVDKDTPIVLITSNYHMSRAVRIAKKAGFRDVHRRPAPSSFFPFPSNVLWEVLHNINEHLKIVKDY